jgi:signal transduction histidine kinase
MKKLGSLIFLFISLSTQAQSHKDNFAAYLNTIQQLTYDLNSFDSCYVLADKMLRMAATDEEIGIANYAKALVIIKNGWGFYLGEMGIPYLEVAINKLANKNKREIVIDAFNTLAIGFITKYNPNNRATSARELEYLKIALRLQEDSLFKIQLPFKVNLQDENSKTEEIHEAILTVSQNLAFWQKRNHIENIMYRTEKLGYLYWQLNHDVVSSKPYLENAIHLADSLGNQIFKNICLSQLAVYSNLDHKYDWALKYGLEGLAHSQQLGYRNRETIFRDQLYVTYKALGQTENALHQKNISLELQEQMFQEAQPKRYQMILDRISELDERNKLEKELALQKSRQNMYTLGIWALMILAALSIFLNFRLRKKNQEIKAASLLGQSIERKRVAADLHDNLGSTISSIQWMLDSVNQKKLEEKELTTFSNLKKLLQSAYDDIRLLSHNLLPQSLKEKGLAISLKELNQKMNKNDKIRFHLKISPEIKRLKPAIEFELYSICLELYNNILHHSEGSEAFTELSIENQKLLLTVKDNGKGYQNNFDQGIGLQNIEERVQAISGEWKVSQKDSEGVANEITLKLKNNQLLSF